MKIVNLSSTYGIKGCSPITFHWYIFWSQEMEQIIPSTIGLQSIPWTNSWCLSCYLSKGWLKFLVSHNLTLMSLFNVRLWIKIHKWVYYEALRRWFAAQGLYLTFFTAYLWPVSMNIGLETIRKSQSRIVLSPLPVAMISSYLLKSQVRTSYAWAGMAKAFFWVFTSQIRQVPSCPAEAIISALFKIRTLIQGQNIKSYFFGWKWASWTCPLCPKKLKTGLPTFKSVIFTKPSLPVVKKNRGSKWEHWILFTSLICVGICIVGALEPIFTT